MNNWFFLSIMMSFQQIDTKQWKMILFEFQLEIMVSYSFAAENSIERINPFTPRKMPTISQTIFWDAFQLMKILYFD